MRRTALCRHVSVRHLGQRTLARILAKTISLAGVANVDPYVILGVLVEGVVRTLAEHTPPERQAGATTSLKQLLAERLCVCGRA
jgi:hypothetical protein